MRVVLQELDSLGIGLLLPDEAERQGYEEKKYKNP